MELTKRHTESAKSTDVNVYDRVQLDSLPKFSELKRRVDTIVATSSWWNMYGVDWAILFTFTCSFPVSLWLLRSDTWLVFGAGLFLLAWIHQAWGIKGGHISLHGGLTKSSPWRRPLSRLFVEFLGSFSEEISHQGHIKEHHPYTNIIGIGDSASWKVPLLPRYVYMFFAPAILLPPITIISSLGLLIQQKRVLSVMKYCIVAGGGLTLMIYLLMNVSRLSLGGAIAVLWVSRGILSIPYIHVNIFQHIGLPMYSRENKPVRIYQMTTGVLNLPRNIILDYAFGHAIISCHVEHHLFPTLSDNMCLKIKPVVSRFIKDSCLPYNEKTYTDCLSLFLEQYDTLMVNAPPITHFVGIQ